MKLNNQGWYLTPIIYTSHFCVKVALFLNTKKDYFQQKQDALRFLKTKNKISDLYPTLFMLSFFLKLSNLVRYTPSEKECSTLKQALRFY